MDIGIQYSSGLAIPTPLPTNWLGLASAPCPLPDWANTYRLTTTQHQNLVAQIGYDQSQWDYSKIGTNNQIGRYQISTTTLEDYGVLAHGSNASYGIDCINYLTCWNSRTLRKNTNSYANYLYSATSLNNFLSSTVSQDHLMYQIIYDTYNQLVSNTAIQPSDSNDIVAGMIYVGYILGVGNQPNLINNTGTGAYGWRYSGVGNGSSAYNGGRYAVTVLS